jgi:hypothetical protein
VTWYDKDWYLKSPDHHPKREEVEDEGLQKEPGKYTPFITA